MKESRFKEFDKEDINIYKEKQVEQKEETKPTTI
jgi:hypothetical protein